MTATVTPITAADRKRAGVPAEHMVRLQGRMAMANLAPRIHRDRRPAKPQPPTGGNAA